jgi:hypothetical protein
MASPQAKVSARHCHGFAVRLCCSESGVIEPSYSVHWSWCWQSSCYYHKIILWMSHGTFPDSELVSCASLPVASYSHAHVFFISLHSLILFSIGSVCLLPRNVLAKILLPKTSGTTNKSTWWTSKEWYIKRNHNLHYTNGGWCGAFNCF